MKPGLPIDNTMQEVLFVNEMIMEYYKQVLEQYPEALTVQDIVTITGYCDTTVVMWCNKHKLTYFHVRRKYIIPKSSLITFLNSDTYCNIRVKCNQHKALLSQT